jgi:hypothetical protein
MWNILFIVTKGFSDKIRPQLTDTHLFFKAYVSYKTLIKDIQHLKLS